MAGEFLVVVSEGDPNVIRLGGHLDELTAQQLPACYARLRGDIEIDCHGLDFVDGSGVGALLEAQRACERRGYRLVIRGLSGDCHAVARVRGMEELLNLV